MGRLQPLYDQQFLELHDHTYHAACTETLIRNKMIKSSKDGQMDTKTLDDEPSKAVLDLVHEAEAEHNDQAVSRAILWKIDLRLLPLLCITYALQSIDKTTLGYASVFDLKEDLNLTGNEYSWLGGIFYLGYLLWEFPTNLMLQRLPINYFMSITVCLGSTCDSFTTS